MEDIKMFGVIYKITNKINGKMYIGQTIQVLKKRWNRHCYDRHGGCRVLHNALKYHGKENFDIEVITTCSSMEEMNLREPFFIKLFNTLSPNGYNLTTGGKNYLRSEETKQNMALAQNRPEVKQKKSAVWNSKSEEEKDKIKKKLSESVTIGKNKPENKKKAAETWANKSEEEKLEFSKKMSEIVNNKSEEEKLEFSKKMSIINKEIQNRPEVKKKRIDTCDKKSKEEKVEISRKQSESGKIAQNRLEVKVKISKTRSAKSKEEMLKISKKISESGKIAQNTPEAIESKKFHAHIRWDVNRGIINPNCRFCVNPKGAD